MRSARNMLIALIATASVVCAAGGCKAKRPDIKGVGPYILGETVLQQASGACSPYKAQTWCTSLQAIKLGDQRASVDLYFDGHGDQAPLVEILLAVTGCNVQGAAAALQHELGKATSVTPGRMVWKGKRAVIVARLPAEGSRDCEISFVHPSQTRTIQFLETGVMPPEDPAGGAPAGGAPAGGAPAEHADQAPAADPAAAP